jgi:hypothetical protein
MREADPAAHVFAIIHRVSFAYLFAVVGNAIMPAYTARRYAEYARDPSRFDDAYALGLAVLVIAQLPLCLLGAAFAGVSYIEGPAWRRVLVYLAVIAVIGVVSGMAKLAWETELGPIVGWAIVMQLTILVFAGPQPDLARARIDAVAHDAVNLLILTPFVGLVAVGLVLAAQDVLDWRHDLGLTDLAWIAAAYFALRTWSAVYVYTPAFDARRKGFFHRPWIEKLVTPNRKGENPD